MAADENLDKARDLLAFIQASPTPYHAVAETARRLRESGFVELFADEEWQIAGGDRRYLTRDGTVIAFVAGEEPPAQAGFVLIGAHTDSPNLRLKPVPDLNGSGFSQLSIEVYGGVLLSTWLDRDLAVAGRVVTRDGRAHLLRSNRALCRVPNLAIHLNREVNSGGLVLNSQTQLLPIFGRHGDGDARGILRELLSEPGILSEPLTPSDVSGFDLCLYDTQAGSLGGQDSEFIFSARLDNLASCHAAVVALLGAGDAGSRTRVIALYDHEEVGSQSATGARSQLLQDVLLRISDCYGGGTQAFVRAAARSFMVSADMAHAVHPNYADKHDRNHAVKLGGGPVIKSNVNQSYATDGVSAALFRSACEEAGSSPQYFASRNDMPCGSTIGPISAARLGIRTVDVGNPMLSMHSCRELAAAADVAPMIRALTIVLEQAAVSIR
jgi:aspartyl aminopeptidase